MIVFLIQQDLIVIVVMSIIVNKKYVHSFIIVVNIVGMLVIRMKEEYTIILGIIMISVVIVGMSIGNIGIFF